MKKTLFRTFLFTFLTFLTVFIAAAQDKTTPKPLSVGYSIGIHGITEETMTYAKSVGIDYIETSINGFIDKDRNFKYSDDEIIARVKKAKKIADDAGIKIWSIHMPFSKVIDISLTDEAERKKVVALHQKVLKFCAILQPEIILFHPSYYLGLNEREQRKTQMIKSARALNKSVRAIQSQMVMENMLGFDLMVGENRERPLMRTVEETVELMKRLPDNIYSAVDMNHIKYPEKLILALGKRLKSVHIADGTGKQENHFFPCSGKGQNNWVKILAALDEVGYNGPFLYESAVKDVKDYKECYLSLFNQFVAASNSKWNYTRATALTLTGKVKETKQSFHRLDTLDYPALPPAVKQLLTNAAGIAISFTTNSSAISAKWCVSDKKQLANMTPIANKGLDLYIKKDGKWQFAGVGRPSADCNEAVLVKNMDLTEKECLLYLPLYDEVGQVEIGVDKNATMEAAATPFKKRILIYGSSIVQGASASRPGLAYPARLSRETGLNFFNLGFSGSAKMEPAVADMVASIPADAYILDCVPNSSPEQIKARTANFVSVIRKHRPLAPIIVIPSIVREHGYFDQEVGKRVRSQNEAIAAEVKLLQQKGVKDLYFINPSHLLGQDHEGTVDGTHPNDIGFDRMLQQLQPEILTILKKHAI
ncbi:SGNH/GDSL hydrolase family protein [Pedobacter immunditicola]|uniref:SGNH/GDSL hydrolase family protein n=1 Tax=Pedobacter immunditicola TaxID=3133440 RepID=UPI0030B69325